MPGFALRELAALKRMFTLAVQDGRVSTMPSIPTLEEDNARQGFIDHGAFISLRDNLPEYLRDPCAGSFLSRRVIAAAAARGPRQPSIHTPSPC